MVSGGGGVGLSLLAPRVWFPPQPPTPLLTPQRSPRDIFSSQKVVRLMREFMKHFWYGNCPPGKV